MTLQTIPRSDYHFFYNFLLVMSAEQIQKLRRIIVGYEKISAFTENEIMDLEEKAGSVNKINSSHLKLA